MRRPSLTRKKIKLLSSMLYDLGFNYRDEPEQYSEEIKQLDEAVDFIDRLSAWHNWKQEQKET